MNFQKLVYTFVLSLLLAPLVAQEKKEDCLDVVYLKGGSVLRGKVLEYDANGNLVMNSWSGGKMEVSASNVKKIVQKCKGQRGARLSLSQRPYAFSETGWYHATRLYSLMGERVSGPGIQHSSGIKINRYAGVGLGVGLENFAPYEIDVATIPIFAELRGYFLKKNLTPFYALGAGYGFSRKEGSRYESMYEGTTSTWQGGWMVQGQLGYRIGNHLIVHFGVRLQHKTRKWISQWSPWTSGTNQIIHKRLDFGIGILL